MEKDRMVILASLEVTKKIFESIFLLEEDNYFLMAFETENNFLLELMNDSKIKFILWEPKNKNELSFLEKIRKYNKIAKIIILSKGQTQGYKIDIKENFTLIWDLEKSINQLMLNVLKETDELISINGCTFDPKEILFIESCCEYKNCVIIHESSNSRVRYPLKQFEKLRDYLIRVDRSLIVNFNKVKHIDLNNTLLYFEGSDEVACVSASNIEKVKKLFNEYQK